MNSVDVDRGWAWVVMVTSCGIQFVGGLLQYGAGIFLIGLLEDYNDSVATSSLVVAAYSKMYDFMGPLASLVINITSCRTASIIGSTLATAGFTVSYFVTDLKMLILTYGVIAGTGSSITQVPAQVVIGYSFKKFRGIAVGLNVAAAGLGMFASGPLLQLCIDTYGVHGSFLILAAISFQCVLFAALMRPSATEMDHKVESPETKSPNNRAQRIFSFCSIFKNIMFVLFLFAVAAWNFPYAILLTHLSNYAMTKNASSSQAAFLITMIGLGSTINRILTGLTQGPKGLDPVLLYMGFLGIAGVLTITFPIYSSGYNGQLVYSSFLGFYSGGMIALANPISIEIVGLSKLSTAMGFVCMFAGLGGLSGPYVAGLIIDTGGTYETSFYISGACLIASSLIVLLSNLWRASTEKNILDKTEEYVFDNPAADLSYVTKL